MPAVEQARRCGALEDRPTADDAIRRFAFPSKCTVEVRLPLRPVERHELFGEVGEVRLRAERCASLDRWDLIDGRPVRSLSELESLDEPRSDGLPCLGDVAVLGSVIPGAIGLAIDHVLEGRATTDPAESLCPKLHELAERLIDVGAEGVSLNG